MARVIFMGTPHFAVPALHVLAEHHQVVCVVTQPDRRAGRGRQIVMSPVKEAALTRGLPIFQPPTLRAPDAAARLAGLQPDLIAIAAFGQILPKPVLDLPAYGCLNVHGSLLPRYRGAAPIPAAILNGEAVTGVSIMCLDEGMDTGPIAAQAELPIAPDDTTASLTVALAALGAQLLLETLPGWLAGDLPAQPQDDELATYCRPLAKTDGLLDWTRPAGYLYRQVRACDPWPGAYTSWLGQRLKVLRARPHPARQSDGRTGQVVALGNGFGVITSEGVLELLEVQLEGKRPTAASQFARGQRDLVGGALGT
jgi:methionyl-tRNA formyltransferase